MSFGDHTAATKTGATCKKAAAMSSLLGYISDRAYIALRPDMCRRFERRRTADGRNQLWVAAQPCSVDDHRLAAIVSRELVPHTEARQWANSDVEPEAQHLRTDQRQLVNYMLTSTNKTAICETTIDAGEGMYLHTPSGRLVSTPFVGAALWDAPAALMVAPKACGVEAVIEFVAEHLPQPVAVVAPSGITINTDACTCFTYEDLGIHAAGRDQYWGTLITLYPHSPSYHLLTSGTRPLLRGFTWIVMPEQPSSTTDLELLATLTQCTQLHECPSAVKQFLERCSAAASWQPRPHDVTLPLRAHDALGHVARVGAVGFVRWPKAAAYAVLGQPRIFNANHHLGLAWRRKAIASAEDEACSICLDRERDVLLPCGHWFCRACIQTVAQRTYTKPPCPACRQKFDRAMLLTEDLPTQLQDVMDAVGGARVLFVVGQTYISDVLLLLGTTRTPTKRFTPKALDWLRRHPRRALVWDGDAAVLPATMACIDAVVVLHATINHDISSRQLQALRHKIMPPSRASTPDWFNLLH